MKYQDLHLNELLEMRPDEGLLYLAGQRALVIDAGALGLLRRELILSLGECAARNVLTRFGFAHGWRTAESLREGFPWDSEADWRRAGSQLHRITGQVHVEGLPTDPGDPASPYAAGIWRSSYEAEQHLLLLGRAEHPVCWALCGFASGYLSRCTGREIYAFETRCVGRGDPVCQIEADPAEVLGPERADELRYFRESGLDEQLAQLGKALKRTESRLRRRRRKLRGDDGEAPASKSPSMRRVLDMARRVARVDTSVLVTGESGTGKERLSRLLHEESPRAGGPFLAVNCGAIPEALLESELFGHKRGAFTGADRDRPGLFEEARGGTLLLDEVGELPASTQVKLLRVLQEREVRPVGSNKPVKVDVRLVAATHRDLPSEVEAGRFREDLLYRLRVVELRLPPLRERREDLLDLARELLAEASRRLGRAPCRLSPAAADRLLAYPWPGNVRQLANALEHAAVLAEGERIEADDLPPEVRSSSGERPLAGSAASREVSAPSTPPGPPGSLDDGRPAAALTAPRTPEEVRPLAEVERQVIEGALAAHQGHRSRTAEALGIGVATLYRKLRSYQNVSSSSSAAPPPSPGD